MVREAGAAARRAPGRMSATSVARPWDPLIEGRRFSPAEGWLTVAMVVLLVESFVWALQAISSVSDAP